MNSEPWCWVSIGDGGTASIYPENDVDGVLADFYGENADLHASRAVTCVNACKDIKHPMATLAEVREALEHITEQAALSDAGGWYDVDRFKEYVCEYLMPVLAKLQDTKEQP